MGIVGQHVPMKVACVVGTRPEAIKVSPLLTLLRNDPSRFSTILISTGQHRELLDNTLAAFGVFPDVRLDTDRTSELANLATTLMRALAKTFRSMQPDIVVVQGDTASSLAGALAAFLEGFPVAHVEAGLRTDILNSPFPEEGIRRTISMLSSIHCAPNSNALNNLLHNGISRCAIAVTGNTGIDAMKLLGAKDPKDSRWSTIDGRVVVLTLHRRESWGEGVAAICRGIRESLKKCTDATVVCPVHPNPKVEQVIRNEFSGLDCVRLVPPLEYQQFLDLLVRADLVITDSGGVQEEAVSMGKSVVIVRDVTDRPEALSLPWVRLVGRRAIDVQRAVETALLTGTHCISKPSSFFGDGHASERIAEVLLRWRRQESPLLPQEQEFCSPGNASTTDEAATLSQCTFTSGCDHKPLITIVIPVYNDWEALEQCLRSIATQQRRPRIEVLIVNDGSHVASPEWIAGFSSNFELRILEQEHLGVSIARNLGVASARGDVLLFVDADCELDPNCLRHLSDALDAFPDDDCFQLRIQVGNDRLVDRAENLHLSILQEHLLAPSGHIRYLNTSGAAIRRRRTKPEGPFEPLATRAQDTALLAAFVEAGELPRFVPNAVAMHRVTASTWQYLRKAFWTTYIEGRTASFIRSRNVAVYASYRQRLSMLRKALVSLRSGTEISTVSLMILQRLVAHMGALAFQIGHGNWTVDAFNGDLLVQREAREEI